MNESKKNTIKMRMERTAKALEWNRMRACIVDTKEEALEKLKEYVQEGDVIGCGGSATLSEIGAIDLFRDPKYHFIDRYRKDMTPDEINQCYIDAFSADVFAASANAITETGELYNVDGNGNRVAPMIFGPKSVVIVAGYNKIVHDLDEAVMRVKNLVAPANAARLNCETYCAKTGFCNGLRQDLFEPGMCGGCHTPTRICCDYVTIAYQRQQGRIKVILVGEELGF